MLNDRLYPNELRTNPPGADLERAATPKGCVPGTARITNPPGAGLERTATPKGCVPGTARITNPPANLERSEFEDFAALELMDLEIGHGIDAFLIDQLFFTRLEMGQPDIGTMPGFQYVLAQ